MDKCYLTHFGVGGGGQCSFRNWYRFGIGIGRTERNRAEGKVAGRQTVGVCIAGDSLGMYEHRQHPQFSLGEPFSSRARVDPRHWVTPFFFFSP